MTMVPVPVTVTVAPEMVAVAVLLGSMAKATALPDAPPVAVNANVRLGA